MADYGSSQGGRELVFCHSCENEWYRDEHGLQCPSCESEIVEIVSIEALHTIIARRRGLIMCQVEGNSDPRQNQSHVEDFLTHTPPSPPQHPLHDHHPWEHHHDTEDPGDPEEGDINHVEWRRGNMHFQSTTYRSPPIRMGGPGGGAQPDNMFSMVSQIMSTLAGPAMQGIQPPGSPPRQPGSPRQNGSPPRGGVRIALSSPLQEGPPRQGNIRTWTTTVGHQPRASGNGPPPLTFPFEELSGRVPNLIIVVAPRAPPHANPIARLLSTILGPNTPTGPAGSFPALFARLLDPTNAQHGDAVYSQEALDRVITQLMDQHRGSTAPGPASPAAIAALPKVSVDKSMLGDNGKAECSVCMDSVNVGDQVTQLPCKHWFHGECVGAWLNEHDTCPHCRQSITPKEGNREEPRSPEQAPLHSPSWPFPGNGQGGASHQQQQGNQGRLRRSSGQRGGSPTEAAERRRASTSSSHARRGSGENGGGGGTGGISGWFSRRMGGGGGNGH